MNTTHPIKKESCRIAIVYLAIGKYDVFWDEFYHSCERYLFPDAEKHYFLFTDSPALLTTVLPNVSVSFRKDEGWAVNALSKYDCMLEVRSESDAFDYLVYINANYRIDTPVWCNEILPTEDNDFLFALSFDLFAGKNPDTYTYDRNPSCQAYIPYGSGKRYYQASFYGGRVPEMLDLAVWCAEATRGDLSKGIMALWHDESYLNKYLLERNPKVIGTLYCKPEEFEGHCRAVLRDKHKIFGRENTERLKQIFINPFMSYLRTEELQAKPLHVVERMGRLGNQMFQYAFLLGLKSAAPDSDFRLSMPVDSTNNLEHIFEIPASQLVDETLSRQIRGTSASCTRRVWELADSVRQEVKIDWPLLSVYQGYWQTELYFKDIAPAIRKAFQFDEKRLNRKTRDMADRIRSCMSVSIHIRRGDYLSENNQDIYGNICTTEYYDQAVLLIKRCLAGETCHFFLFSDDPAWVTENMTLDNAVVIDWNQEADSWQDMYLMSVCRHHIIANSSFSWWGAWLNPREDKLVIAPYRWYNDRIAPDILPEGWIALHPSGYQSSRWSVSAEKAAVCLKSQQQLISRYRSQGQEMPDEYVLKNPAMGKVICLYTYACHTDDEQLRRRADNLLDAVIDFALAMSVDGNAICYLGCGLIYLLRNGFVEGDENEILSDIDWRLTSYAMNRPKDLNVLYGWIHYLTLRIDYKGDESGEFVRGLNRQNLICLLDYLENDTLSVESLLRDIRKIDVLDLYPERTRRLLQKETCAVSRLPEIENRAVTFVIPLRVDSPERSTNLDVVLQQLAGREHTSILILEADTESRYVPKQAYPNVKHLFVKDPDPVFHRTKYLNRLLREAKTELVGIWDTDVVLPDEQIDRALLDICEGKAVMSYPYDGRFYFCNSEISSFYCQQDLVAYLSELVNLGYLHCISNSVGGAFCVRKDFYLEAGGENEAFYGWGLEDQERIRRLFILGLPVTRVEGPLFHLFHPRNENSRYQDKEAESKSMQEFLKVCGMNLEELKCNVR